MRELDPWCKSGVPPPPLRTLTWLQAGEDPCQCPAGARASNHNSCLMWHHRASPGEKPPVCDHCGGQAPLWSSPQAQLCGVHTDYPPCEQRTDAQTFPRTPKPTPLQQRPLVEHVCRCGKVFAWRAPLAPQELMQEAKECRPCAGCRKRFGPNEQQQVGEGPSMCPQGGQASSPRPRALAQRLYACDECGRAFTRTSSLLQHERIYTGERPYECCECDQAFVRCFGLYRHRRTHSAERRGPARGGPSSWGVRPEGTVVRGPLGPRAPVAGEKLYECAECGQALWPVLAPRGAPTRAQGREAVHVPRVQQGLQPALEPEPAPAHAQQRQALRACALCEKAFKGRLGLLQHQRAHTDQRPYGCPKCGKDFRAAPTRAPALRREALHLCRLWQSLRVQLQPGPPPAHAHGASGPTRAASVAVHSARAPTSTSTGGGTRAAGHLSREPLRRVERY